MGMAPTRVVAIIMPVVMVVSVTAEVAPPPLRRRTGEVPLLGIAQWVGHPRTAVVEKSALLPSEVDPTTLRLRRVVTPSPLPTTIMMDILLPDTNPPPLLLNPNSRHHNTNRYPPLPYPSFQPSFSSYFLPWVECS